MRLTSWEQRISTNVRAPWLDSIRHKILAFAAVATLIPSLATAWLSYVQNRRSLTEKISGEVQTVGDQTGREMDLWLKARLYDLRVFANSDEVAVNLDRFRRGERQQVSRISDYLTSVREHFSDYEDLVVLDAQGRVVTHSGGTPGADATSPLPAEWLTDIRDDNPVLGQPFWDEARDRPVMVLAVPSRLDGRVLGALTARLDLRSVADTLKLFAPGGAGEVYLINASGGLIIGSAFTSAEAMGSQLDPVALETLRASPRTAVEYTGRGGHRVVGTLVEVSRLGWAVVTELPTEEAFRQVARLRNLTLLIVAGLLLVVGAIAYVLGLLIVRPLDRLTQGAEKVAGGDLAVNLPVVSSGEVGYLTRVFNEMVVRLREGRQALDAANERLRRQNEELERLSVTDGLTGLYNRRYLMTELASEVHRSQRLKHAFSVMMLDVDHFKRYNDTLGHQAGDEVLVRVAAVLREATREIDCAARYGGEEFLVVLPETTIGGAEEVAERIRARLAREAFPGGRVTLSIGVAEFPAHGETPVTIIASADAALYRAKDDGRDRIERAGRRLSQELQEPA